MKDFKFLLKLFVEKKISYDTLDSCWTDMYLNNHLSENLSDEDQNLLEEVHEKIEYTAENPAAEDRQYGYINPEELIGWLEEKKVVE